LEPLNLFSYFFAIDNIYSLLKSRWVGAQIATLKVVDTIVVDMLVDDRLDACAASSGLDLDVVDKEHILRGEEREFNITFAFNRSLTVCPLT